MIRTPITLLLLLALVSPATAQDAELGSLDFPNSGAPEAQEPFIRGVLALHSFWYDEAVKQFRLARELDPAFALAYWGEATAHDHPLWGQHDEAAGSAVLAALERLTPADRSRWTAREQRYLAAARTLYGPG
ncbi:MAG: hypothetical protein ACREJ5_15630, partial [Geminicoccaceae bacterium]